MWWRNLSLLSIFLIVGFNANAQNGDTTEPVTITTVTTTSSSPPQQVIVSPAPQSANCKTIPAHWKDKVWVAEQNICTYTNRTEGVAWVNDYWACTEYDLGTGNCNTWTYQPGYWLKTMP